MSEVSARTADLFEIVRTTRCTKRWVNSRLRACPASRIKVAGVVALVQLARGLTGKAVDHASAPDSRPLVDHVGPALHVLALAFYRDFRRGGRDKTPPPPAP